MELLLVAAGVVVVIVVVVALVKERKASANKQRLFAEARQFIDLVKECKALPSVTSSIILKPGETAFYSAPSALYETRAVRTYQSGSAGFRIAKGITIGGSKGRSVSTQEWTQIDEGVLTVTNKRLVFDGGQADRTVALGKILSVEAGMQAVEVSVEGRQKSMVFGAASPFVLGVIVRICCEANPEDLSQTELKVTFVE